MKQDLNKISIEGMRAFAQCLKDMSPTARYKTEIQHADDYGVEFTIDNIPFTFSSYLGVERSIGRTVDVIGYILRVVTMIPETRDEPATDDTLDVCTSRNVFECAKAAYLEFYRNELNNIMIGISESKTTN